MLLGAEDKGIKGGVEGGLLKVGTGVGRVEDKKRPIQCTEEKRSKIEVGHGGEEPSCVEKSSKQLEREEETKKPRMVEKKSLLVKDSVAAKTMEETGNQGGLENDVMSFNEDHLKLKYPSSSHHVEMIKKFPRLKKELFEDLENRIPAWQNPEFLNQLYNGGSAEATVAAFLHTKESYEEAYGKKLERTELRPTMGATGGRGRDTAEKACRVNKSTQWLNGLTWAFKMFADFVKANPEFRCFNWTSATFAEIDVYIGYLWLWINPQEGGCSLGKSRYTSDSLKQIKTKFQNVLVHVLKREDVNLSNVCMTFSSNMYTSKRNFTAMEPMEGNAGDRRREALTTEDRAKMDQWMTQHLDQVCTCVKSWYFRISEREQLRKNIYNAVS